MRAEAVLLVPKWGKKPQWFIKPKTSVQGLSVPLLVAPRRGAYLLLRAGVSVCFYRI